jgi:hypothetical protein
MPTDSADITALKRKCRTDLKFLCKYILGMKDWDDSLHGALQKELEAPERHKLFLIPRGHLKSSIITVGWTIQQILINPNTRILITNAVWDLSRTFLREIIGLLTDKSPLADIFGSFNGPGAKFTEDGITIAQRTLGTIKEPTIMTAGVEKAVTGMHFDVLVHDDLVEENNINTPEQIKKIIRFRQNCLDLLDPGGTELLIGTRWAEPDLYGYLITNEMSVFNGKPVSDTDRVNWRQLLKTGV